MNFIEWLKIKLCEQDFHCWTRYFDKEIIEDERICKWCGEIEVLAHNLGYFAEGFHWEKLVYYKHNREMDCKGNRHSYSFHPRTGRYTCLVCGQAMREKKDTLDKTN